MSEVADTLADAVVQACARAGSAAELARRLGDVTARAVQKWRRVPINRLFEVARIARMEPEALRPDLEDWIADRRRLQRQALARERFGLVKAALGDAADIVRPGGQLEGDMIDLLIALAAARFVAGERAQPLAQVMTGRSREACGARSWAMALALVTGRARATNIGAFYGTSRQNVDNAGERYLRARDGDDPEDFVGDGRDGGRVLERGRIRRAKEGQVDFWNAEKRFAELITGAGS